MSRLEGILLQDRTLEDLAQSELIELLRAYNHIGDAEASAKASLVAIRAFPESLPLSQLRSAVSFQTLPFHEARQEHVERMRGEGAHVLFWRIALADRLMDLAWGNDAEFFGEVPNDWALLDEAADLLVGEEVVPYFDHHLAATGVLGGAVRAFSYLEWFDGIYRFTRYVRPQNAT